ncbi:hypothetical protein SpAn4DRAFT_3965 [Sporomusa ovata]|uniref:Uncharacterized protein n=1 Tax=Sporomusa ovata TaxID=2378 RepID=A0A0U1KVH5_9FIRM|nr:hypothetical protein SpAn4DRAFT_3965 [Sporomusa ovata]
MQQLSRITKTAEFGGISPLDTTQMTAVQIMAYYRNRSFHYIQ